MVAHSQYDHWTQVMAMSETSAMSQTCMAPTQVQLLTERITIMAHDQQRMQRVLCEGMQQ